MPEISQYHLCRINISDFLCPVCSSTDPFITWNSSSITNYLHLLYNNSSNLAASSCLSATNLVIVQNKSWTAYFSIIILQDLQSLDFQSLFHSILWAVPSKVIQTFTLPEMWMRRKRLERCFLACPIFLLTQVWYSQSLF